MMKAEIPRLVIGGTTSGVGKTTSGTRLRGHEFHCAQWDGGGSARPAYRVLNLDGRTEGYQCGNLLATFVHLHLATDPSLVGRFVASCARYP